MRTFSTYTALLKVTTCDYLKHLKRKYFDRPKLDIRVVPGGGNYAKKKWETNKDGRTLHVYEICWTFQLIIHNSTTHFAYYPKLRFDRVMPHYSRIDILNHYVPITNAEDTILNGEYTIFEECVENENTLPSGIPKGFNTVSILLQYQNADKQKFYTVFDFKKRHNDFHKFKPSAFR